MDKDKIRLTRILNILDENHKNYPMKPAEYAKHSRECIPLNYKGLFAE